MLIKSFKTNTNTISIILMKRQFKTILKTRVGIQQIALSIKYMACHLARLLICCITPLPSWTNYLKCDMNLYSQMASLSHKQLKQMPHKLPLTAFQWYSQ